MWAMRTKPTEKNRICIRPSPEARHALKRLLTALRAPSKYGEDLTQEDMVSATWLWMAEIPDQVEEAIRLHVEAVRAWRHQANMEPDGPGSIQGAKGESEDVESEQGGRKKKRA